MTATMYRLEMRRSPSDQSKGYVGSLGDYPTLREAITGMEHVAIATPEMFAAAGGQFRLVVKVV